MTNELKAIVAGEMELGTTGGVLWNEAPVPRRLHLCRTWSYGKNLVTGEVVERCACGAIARQFGRWTGRNSRRGS